MVLCEMAEWTGNSLFGTWLLQTILATFSVFLMSGVTFLRLYVNPKYETWQYKSNPKYPRPSQIREECQLTLKCICVAAICPALSFWLTAQGYGHAFCGWGGRSLTWHVISFLSMFIISDFYEWAYHNLGHIIPALWQQHKHHHRFYNPSPFSVIADEYIDQFVRALPLVVFPLLVPTNMDALFGMYTVMFYAYGVHIHSGFELEWPDAHHPVINTSYQHYLHHAVGASGIPAHTGFFIKLWDQLVGADYTAVQKKLGKCGCSKCSRERGERTYEAFKAVEKPDYSVLLKPSFWMGDIKKPDYSILLKPSFWLSST